jgi:hypothetical protein
MNREICIADIHLFFFKLMLFFNNNYYKILIQTSNFLQVYFCIIFLPTGSSLAVIEAFEEEGFV